MRGRLVCNKCGVAYMQEDVLVGWDDERFTGNQVKTRKAVAPVIEWLRTAESDDSDDSSEDDSAG
eukprot:COSAG02_NODE_19730_length_867_cov_1.095052_2_plen_65_part_00